MQRNSKKNISWLSRIKNLLLVSIIVLITSHTVFAAPEIFNDFTIKSDIVAYINGYPIECFSYQNKTLVRIEELVNYGFNIDGRIDEGELVNITLRSDTLKFDVYDGYFKRKGYINIGYREYIDSFVRWQYDLGKPLYKINRKCDWVSVNGKRIESYDVIKRAFEGGWTIFIEDLAELGILTWVPEQRAIKLWLNEFKFSPTYYAPKLEKELTFEVAKAYLDDYLKKNLENDFIPRNCVATLTKYNLVDEDGEYIVLYVKENLFGYVEKYKIYKDSYVEDAGTVGKIKNGVMYWWNKQ